MHKILKLAILPFGCLVFMLGWTVYIIEDNQQRHRQSR